MRREARYDGREKRRGREAKRGEDNEKEKDKYINVREEGREEKSRSGKARQDNDRSKTGEEKRQRISQFTSCNVHPYLLLVVLCFS